MKQFTKGLKDGIPIGLGYLSVSFTFGLKAIGFGLFWWQAVLISMLTVTSAGQFAGVGIMIHPGQYLEMLISQFTINLRYSFMSISLSQKVNSKFKGISRWIFGFMMTDEIFAVASSNMEPVGRSYFSGLCICPYLGWTLGTLCGAILGSILPDRLLSALSLAIYGMFVAIVIPEMKKSRPVILAVFLAILFSCMFYYIPGLNSISSGLSISICAIVSALITAILFPVKEESELE